MKIRGINHDRDDWKYIQSLGVYPDIKNLRDYRREVRDGIAWGERILDKWDGLVPDRKQIETIHQAILGKVHPWADTERPGGSIRPAGARDIQIGYENPLPGDPPARIEEQLSFLREAAKEDFAWAGTNVDRQAQAIASFHVGLKRIQAFADGNGRTGSLFLDHQMKQCFGPTIKVNLGGRDYSEALQVAFRMSDIEPLKELLLRSSNLSEEADRARQQLEATRREKHLELEAKLTGVDPGSREERELYASFHRQYGKEQFHQLAHLRLESARRNNWAHSGLPRDQSSELEAQTPSRGDSGQPNKDEGPSTENSEPEVKRLNTQEAEEKANRDALVEVQEAWAKLRGPDSERFRSNPNKDDIPALEERAAEGVERIRKARDHERNRTQQGEKLKR